MGIEVPTPTGGTTSSLGIRMDGLQLKPSPSMSIGSCRISYGPAEDEWVDR